MAVVDMDERVFADGGLCLFDWKCKRIPKQANGKLSAAATVLLFPYLVGVAKHGDWLRGKAKTAPVRNDVWIGNVLGISKPFACRIDVCAEYPLP